MFAIFDFQIYMRKIFFEFDLWEKNLLSKNLICFYLTVKKRHNDRKEGLYQTLCVPRVGLFLFSGAKKWK